MATKVLGIEIGERLIKVCETNMGPGVRKVSGCIMFQTPPNAVVDGEIKDLDSVVSVLKANLNRNKFSNKKVVFTISSGRFAIREVTLPPVKESKIKALIEANSADYFPVDMSKYHITYTLQEKKTSGEDAGNRLLVMAAPLVILDGYFSLASRMGYSIQAVDYSGNSQFRLLETLHNDGVTMYVDINGTYSITTVLKKSRLLMQRMFPSGVDDYVLAYMSGDGKAEDEYLAALGELNASNPPTEYDDPAAAGEPNEYLSRLVGNITRIADYYNSANWDNPIEKLVLTGIGASVAGLKDAIAEATGLNVSVMTKLDKVSAPNNLSAILPLYISCLGCSAAPVDFIPERYSKAKMKEANKKKESISLGITILFVCIVGAAALSLLSYFNYQSALDEKHQLEKQVADLTFAETIHYNKLSYDKFVTDLTVFEGAIKSPNDALRQFIDELEKKMPAEVNILSASCLRESISMNITVTSKVAAAKTIQQLRSFESINNIVVGQITEVADASGIFTVAFSVDCQYNYIPFVIPEQVPVPAGSSPTADTGAQASGSSNQG